VYIKASKNDEDEDKELEEQSTHLSKGFTGFQYLEDSPSCEMLDDVIEKTKQRQ
jgi:hypothetical protein